MLLLIIIVLVFIIYYTVDYIHRKWGEEYILTHPIMETIYIVFLLLLGGILTLGLIKGCSTL